MENIKNSIITYFKGVRAEWGKIVWPEKPQIIVDLIWVIVVSAIFTLLIFGLDKLFELLLKNVSQLH